MKPSIWTDAFGELEPEEAIERMAKVGWRHLELADKHWRKIDEREDSEKEFENLKELCIKLGVQVLQMHGPMFDFTEDEKLHERIKEVKRSFRWASILGVKWVVLHPCGGSASEDQAAVEKVRKANAKFFEELLKSAQNLNIGIAVENLADIVGDGKYRRRFGVTPLDFLWLVENTASKGLGICWDTGHANIQRMDQYYAIKVLGNHLVATHIADNDTSSDQHLLPFEGTTNWDRVMAAFRDIGYQGLFNLEVGRAIHNLPLEMKEDKLGYMLNLTQTLIEKL